MQFSIDKVEDLENVAEKILATFPENRIFVLQGELGAGKTTLTKFFTQILGSTDEAKSPTFSIINEYLCSNDTSIYHFDFYRIKEETEAMDIGVSEYFYSGNYCFIEWAEKIPNLLPRNYVIIKLEVDEGEKRLITVKNSI